MSFKTADICDLHLHGLQIAEPLFRSFTEVKCFSGQITTVKVFEDNHLIGSILDQPGQGRVLVVDGGGSKRCALIDAELAGLAVANQWQGILVYGCVRHTEQLQAFPIGLCALNVHPMLAAKHDRGERDILISFAGVNFKKDQYLYADHDGILVAETKLD
jgi:regulator of ribonuclease activity A